MDYQANSTPTIQPNKQNTSARQLWSILVIVAFPLLAYSQTTSQLVTPCYVFGGSQGSAVDAFVSIPAYSSAGPWVDGLPQANINHLATHGQIGSCWGVAYNPITDKIYTSAYIKRHTALGPGGTGAIYELDPTGVNPPTVFVDLNALFGANTAGADPHPYGTTAQCPDGSGGTTSNFACWFNDINAWAPVGRQGLGDLDISEDGLYLYSMNMTDKTVYRIPTTNPTASNITKFPFPASLPGATISCYWDPSQVAGQVRPMGLGVRNGKVYAGAICTGEVENPAGGSYGGSLVYIYELNPSTGVWTLVLEGDSQTAQYSCFAWPANFTDSYADIGQRILSDIEFDNAGNMLLGFRDISGDRYGNNAGKPIAGDDTQLYYNSYSGNIVKACFDSGTGKYLLEVDGSCGGNTTGGGATGFGLPLSNANAKEYFFEDCLDPTNGQAANHREVSLGGVAFDATTGEVWLTSYDLTSTYQQGIMGMSNTTGARTSSMVIIEDSGPNTEFGKANGLGDLELRTSAVVTCPVARLDTIRCKGLPPSGGFDYILTTTLTGGTWSLAPPDPSIFIDQDPNDPAYTSGAFGMTGGNTYNYVYDNGTCTDTIKVTVLMEATFCPTESVVFDTLSVQNTVTVSDGTVSVSSATADAAAIIGGEVDIYLEDLSGQATFLSTLSIYDLYNTIEWINGVGDLSKGNITWDGNDNDATVLNPTGLGGIDLSQGGNFGFLASTDIGKFIITLRIYTDGANYSESVFTFNQPGTQFYNIPVEFTSFTTVAGTGADMTNVGAVQLIFEPLNLLNESTGIDFSMYCFHTPCVMACVPTSSAIATNHCQGDGYSITMGSTVFNETNPTGSVTLTNAAGCDSTVTVTLTFLPNTASTLSSSHCQGDGYSITVGSTVFNETNPTGSVTLTNAAGCDSTVTVSLTFLPNTSSSLSSSHCQGDGYSITVGSTVFNEANPTGTVTLTNAAGCDSTLTVTLTFLPNTSSTQSSTHCQGDGYSITVGSTVFNQTNPTGSVTLTNAAGCDSTVTVNLTFLIAPTAGTAVLNSPLATVCASTSGLSVIDLTSLLTGEDAGGTWSQTSGPSASPNFNAAAGTLDPNNLVIGTYTFEYTVTGTAPCPNDTEQVSIVIQDCTVPCPPLICVPITVTKN